MKKLLFILIACGYTFALQAQKISLTDKEIETVRQVVKTYCDNIVLYSQKDDIEAHDKLLKLFDNRNNLVYNDLTEKYSEMEVFNYLKQIVSKFDNKLKVNFLQSPNNVNIKTLKMPDIVKQKLDYEIESENGKLQSQLSGVAVSRTKFVDFAKVEISKEVLTPQGKRNAKVQLIINPRTGKIVNVFSGETFTADDALLTGTQLYQKALVAEEKKDNKKALTYLIKSAEKNYVDAQLYLGSVHDFGQIGTEKNIVSAIKWYRKAVENGSIEALFNIGSSYDEQGSYIEAEKYYLLGVEKGNMQSAHNLGQIYDDTEKYAEAELMYLKAIQMGSVLTFYNIAFLYNRQRKYAESEKYYLWAIEKGNIKAILSLALCYEDQQKYIEAEKYYLLAIQKGDTEASYWLGSFYYLEGREKEAEKYFLLVINNTGNVDNDHALSSSFAKLMQIYYKQEKFADAEKYYLQALSERRIKIKPWQHLGGVYADKGDYVKAEKYYLLAIEKGYEEDVLRELGEVYHKQGKFADAEKYYLLAIKKGINYALYSLGLLYAEQENLKDAERYWLLANEKGINDALYGLGKLNENQEKYKEAIEWYEKYYQKDKENNKNALKNIAICYLNLENFGKADEYISQYIKIVPDDASAYYIKAIATISFDKDEKFGLAKPHYEKFLQLAKAQNILADYKVQAIQAHLYLGRYYAGRKDSKLSLQHYQAVLAYDPQNEEALKNTKK